MTDEEMRDLELEYLNKFGRSYGRIWGSAVSEEERIRRMREALKTGIPAPKQEMCGSGDSNVIF